MLQSQLRIFASARVTSRIHCDFFFLKLSVITAIIFQFYPLKNEERERERGGGETGREKRRGNGRLLRDITL
jgi:hypothetical protein